MLKGERGLIVEDDDFSILEKNIKDATKTKNHNDFGEIDISDYEGVDPFGVPLYGRWINFVVSKFDSTYYSSINHVTVTTPNKAALDYGVDAEDILNAIKDFNIPFYIKSKHIPSSSENFTREVLKEYGVFSEGL